MADAVKKYRLKHGNNHFQDGQFVPGGSVVELTDAQFAAFKDKFVPEHDPLPPPPENDPIEEDDEDHDDDDHDGDGDDDETVEIVGDEGDEESPILKRRREKAEKKAQRKAARDAK